MCATEYSYIQKKTKQLAINKWSLAWRFYALTKLFFLVKTSSYDIIDALLFIDVEMGEDDETRLMHSLKN